VILEIRRLLFDEGLTIAGARKRIGALQEEGNLPTPVAPKVTDEPPAKPKKATKAKPAAKPKSKPAAAKKPHREEVDTAAARSVKPLLATLKDVRKEVAKIVDDLKTQT
jgi:hypothetical protein